MTTRGRRWIETLATGPVQWLDSGVGHAPMTLEADRSEALLTCLTPAPGSRFPRARDGEIGLEQGLDLARLARDVVDAGPAARRPIVSLVDAPSQAYGRTEERLGLHLHLAAAADAMATARAAGHPTVTLVVGHALSGAFLAHGLQSHVLLALDDAAVTIHAMGKPAAARITRRDVAELEALGETVLPLSHDVRVWAQLGLGDLVPVGDADAPSAADVAAVRERLATEVAAARRGPHDLSRRRQGPVAVTARAASERARRLVAEQW